MSEHEYWNELGNLYFIAGAYDPAIHAYARSIELDRNFGRPYSNMALAFVHTGRYPDAIELYHRSIELMTDPKEKAITWNRLGILYRQVKDYQSALVAYEQADRLDSRQDEKREEASRDVKYPLSISMPELDLKAILARPEDNNLFDTVNDELESAETQFEIDWFDGDFVAPNPVEDVVGEYLAREDELLQDASLEEDGWIPLVFEEAIPVGAPFEMVLQAANEQAEESATVVNTWQPEAVQQDQQIETPATLGFAAINEEQIQAPQNEAGSENQWAVVNEYQVSDGMLLHPDELDAENEITAENQWTEVGEFPAVAETMNSNEETLEAPGIASDPLAVGDESFENVSVSANEYQMEEEIESSQAEDNTEPIEAELPFQGQSVEANSYDASMESNVHSTDVSQETVEYSQVEYPLVELSPAEIDSIHIDIARFKRIIQINPRNAFAYDTLGGLYRALGKFKDAITSYQQAIAHDSTKPSYFYQLGLMYAAEKRDEEARDAFQRVLSMDPHHILANASLGSHYRKMGLNDLAQKHIDIALQNVYEEENEYNQACLEAICGNTDRALELLQVAIEDNPSYINWAQRDPDLDVLHRDQRFHMLIQAFAENK
jgi:tetratricopeptide (TPR) repeat protein